MNGLLFVGCWIVGGSLTGMVLFKGLHAGWFTVAKRPPLPDVWQPPAPSEWRSDHISEAQVHRSAKAVNHVMERRVLRADFQRRGTGR